MTGEVRYIIENKRFRRTWDDYLSVWVFIVPIVILMIGAEMTFQGKGLQDLMVGPLLILLSLVVTGFSVRRLRQLNEFEEVKNRMSQHENFSAALEGLKRMKASRIDADMHTWTINAEFKEPHVPPFFEWLTIVCLDQRVLVNSRPIPINLLFWIRRNAIIEIKRYV